MDLALFDFDGTITDREAFVDFVRFAVSRRRLALGYAVLSPLILGHRLGWVSPSEIREAISRVAFRGKRVAALATIGRDFAKQELPQRVRLWARERLDWHKERGDTVVVVSASLDLYLRPWCEGEGVALIATELVERQGVTSGRYLNGDCNGSEKKRRVLQRYDVAQFGEIYAYGDTEGDRDMLNMADHAFFRPGAEGPVR